MSNPIEYLRFRARAQPRSVAIQTLDGGFSYGGLWATVRAMAWKLRQWRALQERVVVTCLGDRQTEWVLTLALMHEGAITCSNHGYAPIPASLAPDLVITDRAEEIEGAGDTLVLDSAWLDDLPEPPADLQAAAYAGGDSIVRLVLSSGTTGESKAVGLSIDVTLSRCLGGTTVWQKSLSQLSMLGLSTGMMWVHLVRTLLGGGTFYDARGARNVIAAIRAHRIRYLTGSPAQLISLVDAVQEEGATLESLAMVLYMGADLSPGALQRIRRVLCANVACNYGSAEAGGVAQFLRHDTQAPPGAAGYVLPEVELQVVDESDVPVTPGDEGRIRLRSPCLSPGYYRDSGATRRSFRDGWFYPGDRALLLEDGMLVLAGRESERINLGGVKINPADVDRVLLDQPGVRDAAAFGYEDRRGADGLAAAVVADEGLDPASLRDAFVRLGRAELCPGVFVTCPSIPRNAMGKPERRRLRERYGAAARGAQADA